jgi:hypothetical protein
LHQVGDPKPVQPGVEPEQIGIEDFRRVVERAGRLTMWQSGACSRQAQTVLKVASRLLRKVRLAASNPIIE